MHLGMIVLVWEVGRCRVVVGDVSCGGGGGGRQTDE